jgi:hypothetical protein
VTRIPISSNDEAGNQGGLFALGNRPFRVRLNATLCFTKLGKSVEYQAIPLGIKKPAPPDDRVLKRVAETPNL